MENKFIDYFSINIGQPSIGGLPMGKAMITFIINDRICTTELNEFTKWLNTITDSNGDQNSDAIKAKKHLDRFFCELLAPWMKIHEIKTER